MQKYVHILKLFSFFSFIIIQTVAVSCGSGSTGVSDSNAMLKLRISGLRGRATIYNNDDSLTVLCDGIHSFNDQPDAGDSFVISVRSHPSHQVYTIDEPIGRIKKSGTVVTVQFENEPVPEGFLKGKRVALSPGHGYCYKKKWAFQRQLYNEIHEDIWTQKISIEYLIPSFERCSAHVINVRERSYEGECIIVDNKINKKTNRIKLDGNWRHKSNGYLASHEELIVGDSTGKATWTIVPSGDGWNSVYTYITPGELNVSRAEYIITHAGGKTVVTVDQSRALYFPPRVAKTDSGVWYPLGTYYFFAQTAYTVEVVPGIMQAGKVLTADAIRFGGGPGYADFGAGSSGKYQWEQDALSFLQEHDAPEWVLASDITSRPLYALHNLVDAYISIHANSHGGAGASGTIMFVWNDKMYNIPAVENQVSVETVQFAYIIHDRIIEVIRDKWNNNWNDNGIWGANFGELREIRKAWVENNSVNIPAILIELAFMDNHDDAELLRNELFLRDVSHAVTKGLIDFFATVDGGSPVYPPVAPTGLTADRSDDTISLSWKESRDSIDQSNNAHYYLIYFSKDGKFFNGQPYFSSTEHIDITVNHSGTLFFKVTAINKGGESLDSTVIEVP